MLGKFYWSGFTQKHLIIKETLNTNLHNFRFNKCRFSEYPKCTETKFIKFNVVSDASIKFNENRSDPLKHDVKLNNV